MPIHHSEFDEDEFEGEEIDPHDSEDSDEGFGWDDRYDPTPYVEEEGDWTIDPYDSDEDELPFSGGEDERADNREWYDEEFD